MSTKKDEQSVWGWHLVSMSNIPAFLDFLDWNNRYKSVTTQIPPDTGLTPVHPAGDRTRDRCLRGSDSTLRWIEILDILTNESNQYNTGISKVREDWNPGYFFYNECNQYNTGAYIYSQGGLKSLLTIVGRKEITE